MWCGLLASAAMLPLLCPACLLCRYIVRTVALKGLELQEQLPPLDELQKFNAASQNDEVSARSGCCCCTAAGGCDGGVVLC